LPAKEKGGSDKRLRAGLRFLSGIFIYYTSTTGFESKSSHHISKIIQY